MQRESTELEKIHQKLKNLEAKNQISASDHVRKSEIEFEAARAYRIAADEISALIYNEKQRDLQAQNKE